MMSRAIRSLTLGLLASALTLVWVSVAAAGYLSLDWDAPIVSVDGTPLTDLARYRVYYDTAVPDCSAPPYREFAAPDAAPGAGERARAVLSELTAGRTYHVRVAAIDAWGNEGPCTPPVSGVARATLRVSAEQDFGTVVLGAVEERTF